MSRTGPWPLAMGRTEPVRQVSNADFTASSPPFHGVLLKDLSTPHHSPEGGSSPRNDGRAGSHPHQSSQQRQASSEELMRVTSSSVELTRGQASSVEMTRGPASSVELTLKDRALAAGAAAMLSAVIMNPLDVAKTRLQAQAAGYTYTQASANAPCTSCGSPWPDAVTRRHLSAYQLEWLWGGQWEPRSYPAGSFPAVARGSHFPVPVVANAAAVAADGAGADACAVACEFPPPSNKAYRGPLDVFLRVIREEGVVRLWKGTSASLLMAVPSVGIYMPLYDLLRTRLEEGRWAQGESGGANVELVPWTAPYAPFMAGAASRFFATTLCAPLELARTRIQAANQTMAPAGVSASGAVSFVKESRGIVETWEQAVAAENRRRKTKSLLNYRVLWRGLGAHVARDVPFSALCWSTLEPLRRFLLDLNTKPQNYNADYPDLHPEQHASLAQILAANFGAGMVAGSLAAAVTTPLDVVKTRVQIELCADTAGRGVVYHLKEILREGGWRALFTGAAPRSLRAGPSVGIIVSFYEILKAVLSNAQQ